MSAKETALSIPVQENLRLVALDPRALQNSQKELIVWANGKMDAVNRDIEEFEANLAVARKNKWSVKRPQAALRYARGMFLYYEKIRDALMAGYYIVPNFPVSVFAIRTADDNPPSSKQFVKYEVSSYQSKNQPNEIVSELPASGEGEYRDPRPAARFLSRKIQDGDKTKFENITEITGWCDVEFPFVMAKTQVLTATQNAMMLKIFDEMAVAPQQRQPDPMVLGIIKAPKRGYAQKQVTFLVAWFLDTQTL